MVRLDKSIVEVQPTPLHKAIYNGRPIEHLLSAGANIYATTSKGYSMLSLAMVQKREEQASLLMDIYEQDMLALQQYFFSHNVRNFFWIREQVLVAHSIEDTNFVQEIVAKYDLGVSNPLSFIESNKKGLIILLKTSGTSRTTVPGVLWITHNKLGDDREIAKITSRIYPNGVLGALRKDHKGRMLMEVAADQQMDNIFFRLDAIFGQHYLTQTEYLRLLCKLSQDCDHEVKCFKNFLLRLNHFNIRDAVTDENGHYEALNYPLSLKQYEIFEYILDEMVVVRRTQNIPSISPDDCKRQILSDFLVHSARIYRILYVQPPDLTGLANICLRYKVDLLAAHAPSKETALHAFVQGPVENLAVGDYIVDNFDVIVEKNYLEEIIHRLINRNWLNVLKQLYERHPIAKAELLRNNNYDGMEVIRRSLQNKGSEMITFLVDALRDEFSEGNINMLINCCAHSSRFIGIIEKLLVLPGADAIKCTYGNVFTSPLFTALHNRKLDNFKLLYKSVENNPEGIKGINEFETGENLLTAAIWSKVDHYTEDPRFEEKLDEDTLQIIDEYDDEVEVERKTAYNKLVEDSKYYDDPENDDRFKISCSSAFLDSERREYNEIFDKLINIGCDYKHVNTFGENLIYTAVQHDNLYVLERLIDLGVDPNLCGEFGVRPIHIVRSVEALRMLLPHLPADSMNLLVTDDGSTPLHTAVSRNDKVLIEEIIKSGATVNQSDNDGNTALHLVKDISVAQVLITHGADINAQNKKGETVAHRQCDPPNKQMLMFFLADPRISWNLVTAKGVSLLAGLVKLSNIEFASIQPALDSRPDSIDRLFKEQCNSIDYSGLPVLYEASHADTNDYCFEKLMDTEGLKVNGEHLASVLTAAVSNLSVLGRLIARGADITKASFALSHAIGNPSFYYMPKIEAVKLLLEAGVDANALSFNKLSPLENTMRWGDTKDANQIIAMLIAAGAKYKEAKNDGELCMGNSILKCLLE